MMMQHMIDPVAWGATLLGLFAVAVAIGALRQPGTWAKMIEEIEQSPALQMLCGFAELFVGAAIYLLSPRHAHDILAMVMRAIGGLMMAEAPVVLAISDLYFQHWLNTLAALQRGWPLATRAFVAGLAVAGLRPFGGWR